MFRIFGPAVAGALMQVVAVATVTLAFYFLAQTGHLSPAWPSTFCEAHTSCHSASLLVRWFFLLTAIGIAFTNNRIITRATEWIKSSDRESIVDRTEYSAKSITVQLAISIIASIVEELDTPPEVIIAIGRWLHGPWLGAILWPALWSVVIAGLGALAYAAQGAIVGGIREE